jgi:hypothetical protein
MPLNLSYLYGNSGTITNATPTHDIVVPSDVTLSVHSTIMVGSDGIHLHARRTKLLDGEGSIMDFEALRVTLEAYRATIPEAGLQVKWVPHRESMLLSVLGTCLCHDQSGSTVITKNRHALRRAVHKAWAEHYHVGAQELRLLRDVHSRLHRLYRTVRQDQRDSIRRLKESGLLDKQSNFRTNSSDARITAQAGAHLALAMALRLPQECPTNGGTTRALFRKDLGRLSDCMLVEFLTAFDRSPELTRWMHKMVPAWQWQGSKYRQYGDSSSSSKQEEEEVPPHDTLMATAFKMCFAGTQHPTTAGVLPRTPKHLADRLPYTPWHYILYQHTCAQRGGHTRTEKWDADEEDTYCLSSKVAAAWDFKDRSGLVHWVSKSSPSDLLSLPLHILLGEDGGIGVNDSEGSDKGPRWLEALLREGGALSWDCALNGWMGDTLLYLDNSTVFALEEADDDARAADAGPRLVLVAHTTKTLLRTVFSYIEDGEAIYNRYSGVTGYLPDGRAVSAKPITHRSSLSRMVKDAHYNHNIEPHLLHEVLKNPGDFPEKLMWDHKGLTEWDPELDATRVRTSLHLSYVGKTCHHCIATRANQSDTMFFFDGTSVAAEASLYTGADGKLAWRVKECRDRKNKTTGKSKAFEAWLNEKFLGIPDEVMYSLLARRKIGESGAQGPGRQFDGADVKTLRAVPAAQRATASVLADFQPLDIVEEGQYTQVVYPFQGPEYSPTYTHGSIFSVKVESSSITGSKPVVALRYVSKIMVDTVLMDRSGTTLATSHETGSLTTWGNPSIVYSSDGMNGTVSVMGGTASVPSHVELDRDNEAEEERDEMMASYREHTVYDEDRDE